MVADIDTQQRLGQVAAATLALLVFTPPLMIWWDWRGGNNRVVSWVSTIPLWRAVPAGMGFVTAVVLVIIIFMALRRITKTRLR